MLLLIIVSSVAALILLAIKAFQYILDVPSISLLWAFSPVFMAVGIELLLIIVIIAVEVTRAALWKKR